MSNPTHEDILMSGSAKWNAWREANPHITPDLMNIDLSPVAIQRTALLKEFSIDVIIPGWEVNTKRADLIGANLTNAKLSGANLCYANLAGARLTGAYISEGNLDYCFAESVSLAGATLVDSSMRYADLAESDLHKVQMHGVDLRDTILAGSSLVSAKLDNIDIRNVNLMGVNLDGALIRRIKYNRKALYQGIRLGSCYGNQRFRRLASDQCYIEEWRKTFWGKLLNIPWKITSGYGRSFGLWALWSLLIAFCYGLAIYIIGSDSFKCVYLPWSFWTAQYYSIVTFSTLGFGDVVPVKSTGAALIAAEVVTGYLMLGGLISVLANKMARRS